MADMRRGDGRSRWSRALRLFAAGLVVCSSAACARLSDLSGPTPVGSTVTSVTLSTGDVTLGEGVSVALQAVARDAAGQPVTDQSAVWSSSDTTVVTVSPLGVLTAIRTGTAQIAVSVAGQSAVASVVVVPRPVASIDIGPLAPQLLVGQAVQLVALPRDDAGNPLPERSVFWSSSNPLVASVDGTGFVLGLSAGPATITARSDAREAAVPVVVSPVPVASVAVTPRVDTIVVGQTTQLTAEPRDSLNLPLVDRPVAWRSEALATASVSASGLVTGVAPGVVAIVAESGLAVGTSTIVVLSRPIGSVIVSPSQATLSVGGTTQLTVQVTDQNGNLLTGRDVVFASENALVAQVSAGGAVRALAVGTTAIRATSEGQTGTMQVTVLPTPVASVQIAPANVELAVGDSVQLTAVALDSAGNPLAQRPVSWSSGAPTVLSVSPTGFVRAVSVGSGLVFALVDGRLASASITVANAPVGSVTVAPGTATLLVDVSLPLTATVRDANGEVVNVPVTWSSSNPLVAVVSSAGTVRTLALGAARIDATVDGIVGSSELLVAPIPVATLTLSLPDSSLTVGQAVQGTAVPRDPEGNVLTGRLVQWTSSAPAVATVSSNGLVTGVAGGSATISATSEGVTASVNVSVAQVVGALNIQTQPAGAVSGAPFTTQPVIEIRDGNGDVVTTGPGATLAVTVTRVAGAATLSGTTTVNAVNGIARFNDLAFGGEGVGAHQLRFATVEPALEVTSASFDVTPGAAAALTAASSQSQSAPVNSPVAAAPRVRVTDAGGNPVAGVSVRFTVLSGDGSTVPASGTTLDTDVDGIAALTTWTLGASAGANSVSAAAAGLTGSPRLFRATGTVGAATQLSITTDPGGAISGRVFSTQPVIEIQDAAGNRIPGATDAVTATILSGSGDLVGTTTVNAVNGVATFTNLQVDGGGAHRLRFNASGLSADNSAIFAVVQVPVALQLVRQPAGAASGVEFTTQPQLRVVDDAGLAITTGAGATLAVTTTVATGSGTLGGTTAVNAVDGVATFADLFISGFGDHTLRFATATPALSVVSATLDVEAGPPAAVVAVSADSQSAVVLSEVAARPAVRVTDAAGNPVRDVPVVFAITAGGGTIVPASGDITTNANGVARLGSWTLGATAGANGLTATVAALGGATVEFKATGLVGPATRLVITRQPAGAVSGVAFTTQPRLELRDVGNNLVVASNATVRATIELGSGALVGDTVLAAVNGVVSFGSLRINGGGNHVLAFTAAGLPVASSAVFNVTQTPASLQIVTSPAGAASGALLGTQPVVRVLDNAGFPVTGGAGASLAVTATLNGGGSMAGTTVVNAVSGVATFSDLALSGTGAHTMTFTTAAPALTVASGSFSIAPGAPVAMVAVAPTSQSALAGAAVAQPPSVRTTDNVGTPVGGVTVVFTVSGGGGATNPTSGAGLVTNGSGVAALESWTLGAAPGANSVTATAAGLTGSPIVFNASGTSAAATQLAITRQPSGAVSGAAFTTQPQVDIRDVNGVRVSSSTATVTATISSGSGTFVGTTAVAAVAGVATFTNLGITGSGAFTITFTSPGLTSASSLSFLVNPPAPGAVAAASPISQSAPVGTSVAAPPTVLVTDAGSAPLPGVAVTFAVTAGGGSTLPASGNTVTTNASGEAALTSWTLGTTAGANTVTATVSGATGSPVVFNATGTTLPATQLALRTAPAGAASGVPFTTQPVVEVQDTNGDRVAGATDAVTVTIASGSGGALVGTQTVNAVNGVATFTNLQLNGPGTFTLAFASGSLTGTSAPVTVTQTVAALVLTTQPSGAASGVPFTTQPVVQLRDNANLLVTTGAGASLTVTAAKASGPAALGGTTAVVAAGGVATFTNLSFGGSGVGAHTIAFSIAAPARSVTSSTVTVAPGAASSIASVSATTQSASVNSAVTAPPSVVVRDASSNPVGGVNVTFAVTAGGGSTSPASGSTIATNASGVATLSSWTVGATPGANSVSATAAGLAGSPVVFNATGTAAAATQLAVLTQPAGAVSGVPFTTQPVIEIRDAGGSRVTSATNAVTVTIATGSGVLAGTATVNAVNGVATFTNLQLNGTGAHTLAFAAAGLTGATSSSLTATQTVASLVIATQPTGAVSGSAFTTQPVVQLRDNANLLVTTGAGATLSVTAARGTGGATLGGTLSVAAVGGIATFSNLSFTGTAGAHSVVFSTAAPALSVASATFPVAAGAASTIAAASPVSQSAATGATVAAPPSVLVTDAGSNPVAGVNVTFAVTAGGGSTSPASGSTVATNASGVATLTSWTLGATPGANSVSATAAGLTGSPVVFNATGTAAAATQLGVLTQPAGAVSGVPFTTQPVIEIRDAGGARVTTASDAVTATIATGTGAIVGTQTVNAVNGVATFANLQLNGSGSHTLAFASGALAGTTSSALTVTQTVVALVLTTQPAGAANGSAFTTQPVVQLRDNANLLVTTGAGATLTVTAARASGAATLGGALGVAAIGGVATFANLAFTGTAGPHTISFSTAAPVLSVTSSALTLTAGAASTIAAASATTQTAAAGAVVTTPPSVLVTDASSNPVAGVNVTFAVTAGGGSTSPASGSTVATNASGVATLTSWTLGATPGANSVSATAAGLTGSPVVFNATGTAAAATQLGVLTQPAGAVSGVPFTTQPVIEIRDAGGARVTTASDAVTATIATGSGAIAGTQTVNAVNGVATFTNLQLNGTGAHTLAFAAGGLTGATSSSLPVTQTVASLVLTTPPGGAASGTAFTTQPVVQLRDNANLLVTTGAGATLTVTAARASGAATLGGTLGVAAVGGVATFTNLAFTGTAGPHTIDFSTASPALSVTSGALTVVAGAASTIAAASTTTQSAVAGAAVATPPTVLVTDASGNPVAGVNITFAVTAGSGTTDPASGSTVATNASGVATLTSWTLGAAPGANSVSATAAGLTGSPVAFTATGTAAPATQLGILTQPSGAVSGVSFTTQPVIEVRDAGGARVSTASDAVTVTIATGTGALVGTQTVNAVNGVATFTNLQLNGTGDHTLAFASGALTGATSATVAVTQTVASLVISTQPAGAVNGSVFTTQPVVQLRDNANLLVTTGAGATLTVTAARASGTATLGGSVGVAAVGGVATFTNLAFTGTAGAHTISFSTASPALSVTSGTVTVTAGAASTVTAISATTQTATVSTPVAAPPSVLVTDASGNPVSGVAVTYTVVDGAGTIDPASGGTINTDANGVATLVSWTLGAAAGDNTVHATVAGLTGSPVVFGATGTAIELFSATDRTVDGARNGTRNNHAPYRTTTRNLAGAQ